VTVDAIQMILLSFIYYIYVGNAISALRMLQKERLVVSRLGNDIYAFECRSVIDCNCLCDTYSCNDDDKDFLIELWN